METKSGVNEKSYGYERVNSGIPGFDEIVNGGLLRGRTFLISGSPGAGKTIFSMQFIYSGASRFDENGVYVTFEETPEQLRKDMGHLGWDLKRLEDERKLILIDASSARIGISSGEKFVVHRPFVLDSLLSDIYKSIKEIGAKRAVIDCLDAAELHAKDLDEFRKYILKLSAILKSLKCTSILIVESPDSHRMSRYGVEEFVTDGIIVLHYNLESNRRVRSIEVVKTRGSKHSHDLKWLDITDRGIEVKSIPKPDWNE